MITTLILIAVFAALVSFIFYNVILYYIDGETF